MPQIYAEERRFPEAENPEGRCFAADFRRGAQIFSRCKKGFAFPVALGESSGMPIAIEMEQEEDGRWIAEVPSLPGCLCYGVTKEEAIRSAEALALHLLAERCESGDDSIARGAFAVNA